MTRVTLILMLALLASFPALGADVSGKWTASIETQIGVQNYTYDFKVDAGKLTGTAKSQFGEIKIEQGAVNGDEITFVENVNYEGQALKITYKGKIAGDEIKFARNVADMANEEFTAKRAK
jgi:hypothetical protein